MFISSSVSNGYLFWSPFEVATSSVSGHVSHFSRCFKTFRPMVFSLRVDLSSGVSRFAESAEQDLVFNLD